MQSHEIIPGVEPVTFEPLTLEPLALEPLAFESAARDVVTDLAERVGLRWWTLAREVEGVRLRTRLDGATRGETPSESGLRELASLLTERDPVVLLDLDTGPEGTSPQWSRDLAGTVIATVLRDGEGRSLATLVGGDPEPQVSDVDELRRVVARAARVLAALLSSEMVRAAALREAARARLAARHDPLTGLLNRAGWEEAMADEEERASRYQLPAAVVIVDLADVMRIWHRRNDHVARLGGDEFAALLVQTGEADAAEAAQRLRRDLADADVAASVGVAGRWANGTLERAALAADRAMYADKRQRRRNPA